MKLKNLIYIGVITILVLISAGFIYMSLSTDSDNANNSIVNNTTNNSNGGVNNTGSIDNSNIASPVEKGTKNHLNLPSKSKLTYNEVLKKANKIAEKYDKNNKCYVKYKGWGYENNELYWDFDMFNSKTNKYVLSFSIQDSTGYVM